MGDFIEAIGSGIVGLVGGAIQGIANVLRSLAASADAALPGGLLAVVIFVGLAVGAWALAKR